MSVTLSLPAVLTRLTDGARTIEGNGATVVRDGDERTTVPELPGG